MNFLVNFAAKLGGISKVWAFMDGKTSYLAGAIGILSGSAGLLQEILKLIEAKDAAMVWEFIKGLPADQNVLAVAAGLGAVGLRRAIAKNAAPAQ